MSVYRIGSVGLGSISKGVHIPGIQKSDDLKLVALCDINPERLKERAAEYGIPAIARMPLDSRISTLADEGRIEDYETDALGDILAQIEKAEPRKVE